MPPALPWRCCEHCWSPSASPPCLMPCLPSFCSSSGIVQRTASFLHRGTNSCSCPALLCLSRGTPAQLGGQEACHPCQKLSHPLCLSVVAGGHGVVAQGLGLVQLHGQGMYPRDLQGWGWNISGVQGSLSCLGGSVGQLEVSWCSWMFSFTMAPAGSLGKVVGSGMLCPCSSGEGNISETPPCWCGLGSFELP